MSRAESGGQRILIVFARSPVLGKVKTRLAADLGDRTALRIYRTMAQSAWQKMVGGRFDRWLFFTPAREEHLLREWLPWADRYVPQPEAEDLGDRHANAFDAAFSSGAKRVVVIGTDVPELTLDIIERGFEALASHSAVLGPSADGGFWLLGLAAPGRVSFAGIEWSTSATARGMLKNLREAGHTIATAPLLSDVDTAEDLKRFPELAAWAALEKGRP